MWEYPGRELVIAGFKFFLSQVQIFQSSCKLFLSNCHFLVAGPFNNGLVISGFKICNSNWTEWSTIQGVIGRVISKSAEREARGQFEITSTITPLITTIRHEVQLLINRNYNKIREEYDSGSNYLTGLYIQLLSYMPKKKSHSSATSASLMTRTVQLLRHDAYNCPITSA